MTGVDQSSTVEPAHNHGDIKCSGGINIRSLIDIRGLSTEGRLNELEQESRGREHGILLLQETRGPESADRLNIGNYIFHGTSNQDTPRGNGTGILVHKSIEVESWHHIASGITAVRVPYGRRHLMVVSAYAPV